MGLGAKAVQLGLMALGFSLSSVRLDPRNVRGVGPAIEVDGLDALQHRPIVIVRWGDQGSHTLDARLREIPLFTLYEDGLVIYERASGEVFETLEARIPRSEVEAIVGGMRADDFDLLPSFEHAFPGSDAPGGSVALRVGDRWHVTRMYGVQRGGEATNRCAPSPAFMRAFRRFWSFDAPNARPFEPQEIEVRLWDFATWQTTHPPMSVEFVPWPSSVPAPEHVERNDVAIVMDVAHEPAFIESIGLERPVGVRLEGRDYLLHWTYAIPAQSYVHALFEKSDGMRNVVDVCD